MSLDVMDWAPAATGTNINVVTSSVRNKLLREIHVVCISTPFGRPEAAHSKALQDTRLVSSSDRTRLRTIPVRERRSHARYQRRW